MNYKELTTKFRELARDLLRMRWINNVMDDILYVKGRIKEVQNEKDNSVKEIEKNEYKLSKLEENDPEFTEKTEKFNADIVAHEEKIKLHEQSIEEVNKIISDYQEKIQKIESGELKVNAENLSGKAKELVDAYFRQQAAEIQ